MEPEPQRATKKEDVAKKKHMKFVFAGKRSKGSKKHMYYELRTQKAWPPDFIPKFFKLFLGFMTSFGRNPIHSAKV